MIKVSKKIFNKYLNTLSKQQIKKKYINEEIIIKNSGYFIDNDRFMLLENLKEQYPNYSIEKIEGKIAINDLHKTWDGEYEFRNCIKFDNIIKYRQHNYPNYYNVYDYRIKSFFTKQQIGQVFKHKTKEIFVFQGNSNYSGGAWYIKGDTLISISKLIKYLETKYLKLEINS